MHSGTTPKTRFRPLYLITIVNKSFSLQTAKNVALQAGSILLPNRISISIRLLDFWLIKFSNIRTFSLRRKKPRSDGIFKLVFCAFSMGDLFYLVLFRVASNQELEALRVVKALVVADHQILCY